MAQTVKLPDDIMKDIRSEAALQSRSLASQVVHWINLGRKFENAPETNMAKIRAALKGELNPDELSEVERLVFFEEGNTEFKNLEDMDELDAAYAALED